VPRIALVGRTDWGGGSEKMGRQQRMTSGGTGSGGSTRPVGEPGAVSAMSGGGLASTVTAVPHYRG
jgi:hypothetical protein